MKIRWNILIVSVLLLLVLTTISQFSIFVKKEITINASLFDVASQITGLENWKNWYPGLETVSKDSIRYADNGKEKTIQLNTGKGGHLIISILNPATIQLREEPSIQNSATAIAASAVLNGTATEVSWVRKIKLYHWLAEKLGAAAPLQKGLQQLKIMLEDPGHRYGFRINIRPVTDTLILTVSANVTGEKVIITRSILYERLNYLVRSKHLKRSSGYYFTSSAGAGSNNTIVSVGMPVSD